LAKSARDAALEDAQDMGEVVLKAEARLGEILKAIPGKQASSAKGTRSLPEGITKKQSHIAQTLAKNEDIINEVIEEAKENEEV